jgi:gliding motility-associated-like protein
LEFSTYQGWLATEGYDVFEIRDDVTTLKTSLPPNTNTIYEHREIVQNLEQILGLRYYIVAREGSGNPHGLKATAKSNVVIVINKDTAYFATGFVPDGLTPTYYPIYVPLPGDVMQFQIYNKFGEIVFSTNKHKHGWDGNFKGQAQPGGVYIYSFMLNRTNGKTIRQKGWFMIIRRNEN